MNVNELVLAIMNEVKRTQRKFSRKKSNCVSKKKDKQY